LHIVSINIFHRSESSGKTKNQITNQFGTWIYAP